MTILGAEWLIEYKTVETDENLKESDGYCDKTTRRIVIDGDIVKSSNLGKPEKYLNKVLRHEIVHAFLFESGLAESSVWNDPHAEQLVDWIAYQGMKICECWKQANCYD